MNMPPTLQGKTAAKGQNNYSGCMQGSMASQRVRMPHRGQVAVPQPQAALEVQAAPARLHLSLDAGGRPALRVQVCSVSCSSTPKHTCGGSSPSPASVACIMCSTSSSSRSGHPPRWASIKSISTPRSGPLSGLSFNASFLAWAGVAGILQAASQHADKRKRHIPAQGMGYSKFCGRVGSRGAYRCAKCQGCHWDA